MKINKKGFTLIELLAVIVIIAVIALIAFPAFSTIITNSRKDAFLSSALSAVGAAEKAYLGNNMSNAGTTGCKLTIGTGGVELTSNNLGGVIINASNSYIVVKEPTAGTLTYTAYLISSDSKTMINGMTKDDLTASGSTRRGNSNFTYNNATALTLTAAPATSCA